jgi:peptidoglycan/LPS O-acetylase OafA/YrhL
VLSGFLITGILLDTRECQNYFKSFYCRRMLRIFPLYYSFLLVALVVFPRIIRPDSMPLPADCWLYPTYLMNWKVLWKGPMGQENVLGPFWSLCVEEQFYFVWPLVVLAMKPRFLLGSILTLEGILFAGRSWWVWNHGGSVILTTATITRMDGLLMGAACALVVRQCVVPEWLVRLLPATAVLLMLAFIAGREMLSRSLRGVVEYSAGYAVLAVAFAAILLYAVLTDSQPGWLQTSLRWKPLTRFGKYAYGIYVFHVALFYFVNRAIWSLPTSLQESFWFGYLVLVFKCAMVFAVASLSYNFFEKRFLKWKDRFEAA